MTELLAGWRKGRVQEPLTSTGRKSFSAVLWIQRLFLKRIFPVERELCMRACKFFFYLSALLGRLL